MIDGSKLPDPSVVESSDGEIKFVGLIENVSTALGCPPALDFIGPIGTNEHIGIGSHGRGVAYARGPSEPDAELLPPRLYSCQTILVTKVG